MKVTRRELLRYGSLGAAAGLLGKVALAEFHQTQAPGAASPIRLGLASYTFRNFTRDQMLGFMKDLHVTALNAKDVKDHLPTEAAAEAAAVQDYRTHGVDLHAAGTVYFPKDEDADIRAKFDYCRRAGVKVVVSGDPTPATLPRLERFVKEYDIKLAIHNHGPEDGLWKSPLDVLAAVKNMDPRMGCCIDVGHTVRAGTDVIDAIHRVGDRLHNVHMKDLTDFHEKGSQVAVGDGKMPVKGIFEALLAIRYPGFVDLEYEVHGDDPLPGATRSFAYMRGVLASMGYRAS